MRIEELPFFDGLFSLEGVSVDSAVNFEVLFPHQPVHFLREEQGSERKQEFREDGPLVVGGEAGELFLLIPSPQVAHEGGHVEDLQHELHGAESNEDDPEVPWLVLMALAY